MSYNYLQLSDQSASFKFRFTFHLSHFKFLLFGLMLSTASFSQDDTVKKLKDDATKAVTKESTDSIGPWKTGGIFNINLAQSSLTNWAGGGEKFSLALSSLFNYFAFYKQGVHSWDNNFDFNLGYVKTTSLGGRKNDDRIDLLSKYGRAISPKMNIAGLFNFRSQLLKGYTYNNNIKEFSSAFLSPAYILLSPGLDYKPNQNFSIFVSPITTRWVIVRDDTLSAKGFYGVEPGKKSRNEIGAFLNALFAKDFNKILGYKGRLELFSNYKRNPQNVDFFMTNLFSVKLSQVLAATWSVDLIYDDDVRMFGDGDDAAMQMKSLVGVGLLWKL